MSNQLSLQTLPLVLSLCGLTATAARAADFEETFALAADRGAVLRDLVPGTEDYYYFNALHAQNSGRAAEVKEILNRWAERFPGGNERRALLETRQKFLDYPADPAGTMTWISSRLGLTFDHKRVNPDTPPDLPSALDQTAVTVDAFRAAAPPGEPLASLTETGLRRLVEAGTTLNAAERRALLSRLTTPDLPRLTELVLEDLRGQDSGGFGSLPIHNLLLADQLADLAEKEPALKENEAFVRAWTLRLAPPSGTDPARDPAARLAWLERLEAFTGSLSPAFNSLKAQVLFRRLEHERKTGAKPDPARLAAYLRLPRQADFIHPSLRKRQEAAQFPADLGADYSSYTGLPAPGDDTTLVRSLLLEILTANPDTSLFRPLLEAKWLAAVLAEARLTSGAADAERHTAALSPAEFQALRDRTDLEFAPGLPEQFTAADDVTLRLFLKNTPRLLVKVYEINTENHYRVKNEEVNTDLDLDGLVANREFTADYTQPPMRRSEVSFAFPEMKGRRGVWMVEFIGGGKSGRAVVRKGGIRAAAHSTAAGTAVTVTDETGRTLPRAWALLGAQKFEADERGVIDIPFTATPGGQNVILGDGEGFSVLETLDISGENYRLSAGIHVPREFLLPGRSASAVIRPSLLVNGRTVDPALLENPRFTVTTDSFQGGAESGSSATTTTVFPVKTLSGNEETLADFRVPENARYFTLTLSGSVKNLTNGQPVELSDSVNLRVNGISGTQATQDSWLSRGPDGWSVDRLGKNGEPISGRVLEVVLWRPEFQSSVRASLRTDEMGRARLGALEGVSQVQVQAVGDGIPRAFDLNEERATLPTVAHVPPGGHLRLPWPWTGPAGDPARGAFTLIEVRGGLLVRQVKEGIAARDGVLETGALEPGEYKAWARPAGAEITVRVAAAPAGDNGRSVTPSLALELDNPEPLAITDLPDDPAAEGRRFRLVNADPETRVHVFVSRFAPEFDAFAALRGPDRPVPAAWRPAWRPNLFQSARTIGEEYRYVLERRAMEIFAGNLLPRPGLLVNPWAVADTSTALREAAPGEMPSAMAADMAAAPAAPMATHIEGSGSMGFGGQGVDTTPDYSFLREQGALFANLRPDEDGIVTVRQELLEKGQWLRLVAVDGASAVSRDFPLAPAPLITRDLRLAAPLDPAKRHVRKNGAEALETGKAVRIPLGQGSGHRVYGSLRDAWTLYAGLSKSPVLETFRFLPSWPTLSPEEKRRHFSENACHELSFFLFRKDPEFFRSVVLPHIANKREKEFMDEWLADADLTPYLVPWKYNRLNTLERILLGRKIPAERAAEARALEDAVKAAEEAVGGGLAGGFESFQRGFFGIASTSDFGDPFANKAELADRITTATARAKNGYMDDADARANKDSEMAEEETKEELARDEKSQMHLAKKAKLSLRYAANQPADVMLRQRVDGRRAVFFRTEDPTKEWAENQYFHVPAAQETSSLVPPRRFWSEFAAHADDGKPFLSGNIAEPASGSPSEMLLALAVLDLPFEDATQAVKEEVNEARDTLILTPSRPALLFRRAYTEAERSDAETGLRLNWKFASVNARPGAPKPAAGAPKTARTGEPWKCSVVVTNTGDEPLQAEVLFQIPQGAVPLEQTLETQVLPFMAAPSETKTFTFAFYFPAPGKFVCAPAQVSVDGAAADAAEPVTFEAVEKLDTADRNSWEYVSQNASADEVIAWMEKENLSKTGFNGTLLAWRLGDKAFFHRVLDTLRSRRAFDPVVWSYALRHGDTAAVKEYVEAHTTLPAECGPWLDSPLLHVEPGDRGAWRWLEYSPLINARAHTLGGERAILNDRYRAWHASFMRLLSFRPSFTDDERLGVTADLLLQDRVGDALVFFRSVDPAKTPARLQYDYLHAWLAMCQGDVAAARSVAAARASWPVDRWREKFAALQSQLDELDGREPASAGPENRALRQNESADAEPGFEFKIEGGEIALSSRNVRELTVNYYPMDLEFLFSANPFVSQDTGRFRMIRPDKTERVAVPEAEAASSQKRLPLPEAYRGANVLVEITAAGQTRAAASYANTLDVRLSENQGLLQVTHAADHRPLSKVYVKVFAEVDGRPVFHKDGYTDLRGKFDYASLSTEGLDRVSRFAILIMSPDHGATVRETAPPRR